MVLQFPLIPQWNAEQDTSRSMPDCELQLALTFLKTNFLDRSFLKNPSCERDSFIFRVFYDRSNSAQHFMQMYNLTLFFSVHPRIPGTHFVRLPMSKTYPH